MNSIKFNSVVFNLVDTVNADVSRLQATIYKGNYTVDQIANATRDCNLIQVLDGNGKIIGQYSGYTSPIAYSMNFMDNSNEAIVSIELQNNDIVSRINALSNQVNNQSNVITGINDSINRIDDAVDTLASIIGE